MAPVTKPRGGQRQLDLDLSKYESLLEGVPDDASLGRLQDALETLLSERSHPMIVTLTKQQEQLRTAQNVIDHEIEVRKSRKVEAVDGDDGYNRKKRRLNGADRSASSSSREPPDNNARLANSFNVDLKASRGSLGNDGLDKGEVDTEDVDSDIDDEEDEEDDTESKSLEMDDKVKDTVTGDTNEHEGDEDEEDENEGDNEDEDDDDEDDDDEDDNEDDDDPTNANEEENANSIGDNFIDGHRKNTAEKTTSDYNLAQGEQGGNNKFIANPKSEFVSTQTFPVHAFSIFTEHDHVGDDDEEAYKRKLGVVSYPKEDLSTLTAGPVPTEDYTRAKPSNQVQFSTFATFLEPYFRPFVEEDIHFLTQPTVGGGVEAVNAKSGKKLSPYVLPPLGPHYHQTWAIQDAELSGTGVGESVAKSSKSQISQLKKLYDAAGSVSDLSDQKLESISNSISLGPLTERLVAAIFPEAQDLGNEPDSSIVGSPLMTEKTVSAIPPASAGAKLITDFAHLEERVRNEFRYVGVLDVGLLHKFEHLKNDFKLASTQTGDEFSDPTMVDMDWINGAEDDEISRELRVLQARLKVVSRRNAMYKSQLIPVIQEQLAWQEYQTILQDLDKQVDQAFLKRSKVPQVKQKKRKGSVGVDGESIASTPQAGVGTPDSTRTIDHKPAIKALIDKRERWITKIGPLFKPGHEMMREYEKPKFTKLDEDDGADDEDDGYHDE